MRATEQSFTSIVPVTPANADIRVTDAIYIGGTGNLDVVTLNGETATITAPVVGTIHRIRVRRVLTTSTATNILAMYY